MQTRPAATVSFRDFRSPGLGQAPAGGQVRDVRYDETPALNVKPAPTVRFRDFRAPPPGEAKAGGSIDIIA
ncbi:MAG: hypothetical protein HN712_30355 [Gemmatimonadetes bacterium]|nr:hypothetical protein [Gemmatimonadota bacterium]MBT6150243.1 hypothetical protein [Gemmatimonadota bacterium]MBT7864647.1 hypothetical protein [Gemmatimonadota bacterium]